MKPPFAFDPFGGGGEAIDEIPSCPRISEHAARTNFDQLSGAVYEYTFKMPVTDAVMAEDLELLERKDDREKIEAFNNQTGSRFVRSVHVESDLCVAAMCEIVSATKFEKEQLYVQWKVVLPPVGWAWSPELSKTEIEALTTGSTQVCTASYNSTGKSSLTGLIHPTANFAFPLELHFVSSIGDDVLKAQNQPRIFFEVGSAGSWGRHYNEGYGYLTIPREAGMYDLTVNTWKPHGSIIDRMDDFFLGGSRHLKTIRIMFYRPAEQGPLNKYDFQRSRPVPSVTGERDLASRSVSTAPGAMLTSRSRTYLKHAKSDTIRPQAQYLHICLLTILILLNTKQNSYGGC